jgi:hypothetical protein
MKYLANQPGLSKETATVKISESKS